MANVELTGKPEVREQRRKTPNGEVIEKFYSDGHYWIGEFTYTEGSNRVQTRMYDPTGKLLVESGDSGVSVTDHSEAGADFRDPDVPDLRRSSTQRAVDEPADDSFGVGPLRPIVQQGAKPVNRPRPPIRPSIRPIISRPVLRPFIKK